jgi:hypothetical protein
MQNLKLTHVGLQLF